jgi:hypothetical protein
MYENQLMGYNKARGRNEAARSRTNKHGGEHDRWTNGKEHESIPRHTEIKEFLAKKILKKAEENPPQKEE